MDTIHDFDRLILQLHDQIRERPDQKFRILLQVIRETKCPYLRRKLRAIIHTVN